MVSAWSLPSNGTRFVTISYINTPNDHTSTLVSYFLFSLGCNISGAIYNIVPQTVFRSSLLKKLDQPKSASFTLPSPSIKIFSPFISLCIIGGDRLCKYSSADTSSLIY